MSHHEHKLEAIATDRAPAAIGPYSQAIHAGKLLFVSGQLGLDPATKKLVDGGVAAQARRALDNLAAILEAAEASLDRVTKTTIFLTDMAHFAEVNAVYAEKFGDHRPARSTIAVAGLPLGGLVEIEAIARLD